jgi:hypothetical protein
MTSSSNEQRVEINRALFMGGLVLVSAGAVLGMVGALATSAALVGAARSWMRQLDEPPSAMARRRWAQARSAAAAGAQGWRQNETSTGSVPSPSTSVETIG